MTPADIRQKLHQQIDQLPANFLLLATEFLEFLKSRHANETTPSVPSSLSDADEGEPILTGSTGADLLQFAGTWQGNDFEECLEAAYETRSPAEF